MFSNAFQSGTHVEVFDSKGTAVGHTVNKDKNEFYAQLYKATPANGVKRDFDKTIKSYLFELEGQTTKLSFPKDDHKELCLVQQYLVLQLYIPQGFPWSLELTFTDTTKCKRRVNLTTAVSKTEIKFFHVKQPIDHRIKRNTWLNLAIDCYSFMAAWKGNQEAYSGQTYRSLDQITLGAYCKLRRIFTMRDKLIEFSNDDEAFEPMQIQGGVFVPKGCQLNPEVIQSTQVIVYDPPQQTEKSVKESSVSSNLASSSVKTTKKQPSIHVSPAQESKTISSRVYAPEPAVIRAPPKVSAPVMNKPQKQLPSAQSTVNSLLKSTLSNGTNLEKHHHIIPEHKEDEESDEALDHQKQLKRDLQKYEKHEKNGKFEPIGKVKKVFLSDVDEMPVSRQKESRQEQPAKIQIVRVRQGESQSLHRQSDLFSKEHLSSDGLQQLPKERSGRDQQDSEDYNYEDEGFEDSLEKEEVEKIQKELEQVRVGAQKLQSLFPTSTITKKNSETVVVQVKGGRDIELVYDETLDCYYDPHSNTYYSIN